MRVQRSFGLQATLRAKRVHRRIITKRLAVALLLVYLFLTGATNAQEQLLAFRDPGQTLWGYKRPDGRIAISPRYVGAGAFREGRAPVKDADGFAIIDGTGRIVQRIATDSVSAPTVRISPPADACAWSASAEFPTDGLQCYVRQLRGAGPATGGEITVTPGEGESSYSSVVLKFPSGVVVIEEIGYEGFTRRVLLPGVAEAEARQWRLKLYRDPRPQDGCAEVWKSGVISGGAFIEQGAGC